MAAQLSLFADAAPPKPELLARLQPRLRAWAEDGIYFGTSSWKYPGWQGQIYHKAYKSQRAFEQTCIAEYAETFPTVCGDFALYDFPHPTTMRRIADATPEHFTLSLKVTDRITIFRYPALPRYGSHAGRENNDFLNPDLFQAAFLRRWRSYAARWARLSLNSPNLPRIPPWISGILPSGSTRS